MPTLHHENIRKQISPPIGNVRRIGDSRKSGLGAGTSAVRVIKKLAVIDVVDYLLGCIGRRWVCAIIIVG